MGRTAKPRKAYRPRPLLDPVARAMVGVRTLAPRDVQGQIAIARAALAELGRGADVQRHWRSLADTANMAESLAGLRIGSGPEADHVIRSAQQALADIHARLQRGAGRALYAAEVSALTWLVQLHAVQLEACSHDEFDAAYRATERRISQALAGNAAAGAIVIEGEIA